MFHRTRAIPAIAIMAVLALGLAACGSSSNNGSSMNSAGANTTTGGQTVATKSIAGTGTVLVDSSGMALYTNNMDNGSKIACTNGCTAFWTPLAAPSGGQPTSGDSAVQAKLGTIKRSDGTTQVTFGGKPLYGFVQDSPGKVTGNGFSDQFGGTAFTWTVASAGGASAASSGGTTSSSSSSGGSGYGGGY